MYARAVDDAAARLRELRQEEWGDFGLAAFALGLAVVGSQARPELAMPLFLAGLTVAALGVRALWREWDLLDRLAGERYAYVIPQVLAYAAREATTERRLSFAAQIRARLQQPADAFDARGVSVREELEALATELEDRELSLDPACAVACMRLLTDAESPFFAPEAVEDLRSQVRQVRAGFGPAHRSG
jgi:hypothetical protein